MATTKHEFQKFVFNPTDQHLMDFLDNFHKLAKDAFGVAAHAIIEQIRYAKMPPHLKKSIPQAHLEKGMYERSVTHLERNLELNVLEAPDELQINNVCQQPTNINAARSKPTCHHCRKPGDYRNRCLLLKKQGEHTEKTQNDPGNKNSGAKNSNPNSNVNSNNKKNSNNNHKNSNRAKRKPRTVYPFVRSVQKQTTPQRNATLEPMQPIDYLPGTGYRKDGIRSKREPINVTPVKFLKLQPKI